MPKIICTLIVAMAVCCLLFASPLSAEAARSHHAHAEKSSLAKKHHRSEVRSSKHHHRQKRHSVSSRHHRKARLHARNTRHRRTVVQAPSDTTRELWMRRAKDSELMTGIASWYGADAHGGATASGVSYDMYTFTAAHRTLPLGTVVRVTDQDNGKSVMVCVTDRGPYVRGRIIDLSYAAAQQLDLENRGVGRVALSVVSDANGTPLKPGEAYYIRYKAAVGMERVGPFRAFADAAAMHEALRRAHPEAEVVLGRMR